MIGLSFTLIVIERIKKKRIDEETKFQISLIQKTAIKITIRDLP